MRDSEVKEILRRNLPEEVTPSMVKRCVSALPETGRGDSVSPLIKLQAAYFPKWLYAALGLAFLLLIVGRGQMSVSQMIWRAGQVMYGAALLLGIHLVFAGRSSMFEMECACKYQYSQIYLARLVLAVGYLFLLNLGLNVAFVLQFGTTRVIWNVLVLFPLVAGAVCALFLMRFLGIKGDGVPFAVLVGSALAVQLFLHRFLHILCRFELAVTALFGFLVLFVLVQGWCVIGRKFTYEAYNM